MTMLETIPQLDPGAVEAVRRVPCGQCWAPPAVVELPPDIFGMVTNLAGVAVAAGLRAAVLSMAAPVESRP